jgi:hypothetical protein
MTVYDCTLFLGKPAFGINVKSAASIYIDRFVADGWNDAAKAAIQAEVRANPDAVVLMVEYEGDCFDLDHDDATGHTQQTIDRCKLLGVWCREVAKPGQLVVIYGKPSWPYWQNFITPWLSKQYASALFVLDRMQEDRVTDGKTWGLVRGDGLATKVDGFAIPLTFDGMTYTVWQNWAEKTFRSFGRYGIRCYPVLDITYCTAANVADFKAMLKFIASWKLDVILWGGWDGQAQKRIPFDKSMPYASVLAAVGG